MNFTQLSVIWMILTLESSSLNLSKKDTMTSVKLKVLNNSKNGRVTMNKQEFNQFREDFSQVAPSIGRSVQKIKFGVKDDAAFYMLEAGRDNVGKICFSDLFSKKYFPNHFFQINQEGFLNGRKMRTLQSVLHKKKLI